MNIDWNLIKNKYPKAYKKITFNFKLQNKGAKPKFYLENDFCYCDLEKFFDDNGIFITIPLYVTKFCYLIFFKGIKGFQAISGELPRDEAKEQAIYKACEVLEKALEQKE